MVTYCSGEIRSGLTVGGTLAVAKIFCQSGVILRFFFASFVQAFTVFLLCCMKRLVIVSRRGRLLIRDNFSGSRVQEIMAELICGWGQKTVGFRVLTYFALPVAARMMLIEP